MSGASQAGIIFSEFLKTFFITKFELNLASVCFSLLYKDCDCDTFHQSYRESGNLQCNSMQCREIIMFKIKHGQFFLQGSKNTNPY